MSPRPSWCECALIGFLGASTVVHGWSQERGRGADRSLVDGFANPPARARPDAFWAWLNGHADPARITEEMEAFRAAGFSRLQVWDVKAHRDPEGIVPVGPPFLSDDWLAHFAHADREAKRLGLELGLVAASGWNAGGDWVEPDRAGLSMYSSVMAVEGGADLDVVLDFPGTPDHAPRAAGGMPAYWATIAVQAHPADEAFDVQKVVDLTGNLGENGRLRADLPAGRWEIHWLIRANTGQRLIVPSPRSDGLQIDFFDARDSEWYFTHVLDRLESALGPLAESSLRYLEVDSLELEGDRLSAWTETILDSFRARFDYDATPWLTLLIHPDRANARGQRFLHDWTRLVSDLMIENHYRLGNRLLQERGLLLSAEAGGPGPPIWYSCPVDAIGALGATGLMRGEFWPKQRSMYNVKEIACAAHTYGVRVVDAESFTSWRHWRDLPYYMKLTADQAFLDGLNHITFHTAPHNGAEPGLPGYAYHAGTHVGPNVVWWSMAKPFIDDLTRCSFLLQEGLPVADVCFYQGDGAPVFHPLGVDWNASVRPAGYDYDVVDVRMLVEAMTVKDGRLRLPSGTSYRALVLPASDAIDLSALGKIAELVEGGATVLGPRPSRATGLCEWEASDAAVRSIAETLWSGNAAGRVLPIDSLAEVLAEEPPDFEFEKGDKRSDIGFVHRSASAGEIYFLVNENERWERVHGLFRVEGLQPELWDSSTGEITRLDWEPGGPGRTRVTLTFPPGGSQFVVFRRTSALSEPGLAAFRDIVRKPGAGVDVAHGDTPNGPTWVSSGDGAPAGEFIVFDLGATTDLDGIDVWNYQHQTRGLAHRGVREMEVSVSEDGTDFASLGVVELERAPDIGERDYEQRLELRASGARFVRFDVQSNHSSDWLGHTDVVGLCRVAFLSEGRRVPTAVVHAVSSGLAHDPATDDLRALDRAGIRIAGPWTLRFPSGWGAPEEVTLAELASWSSSDVSAVAHFSGIATYSTTITVPEEWIADRRPVDLDLGRVAGVARVFLNDREIGVTWKPPYSVEVTHALKSGVNELRVDLANTWHNRLVGDAALPARDRITVTNIRGPFTPETPLLEAGLIGPVRLVPE